MLRRGCRGGHSAHVTHGVRGFGIVDVLIGLLLLTIGLLSTVGLHIRLTQNARTAQHRASASQLAQDLVERMRANLAGVAEGHYDVAYAASGSPAVDHAASMSCAIAERCSVAEITAYDFAQWHVSAARLLPAAGVSVHRNATEPPSFDIRVIWTPGDAASHGAEVLREACPASIGAGDNAHCLHLRGTP